MKFLLFFFGLIAFCANDTFAQNKSAIDSSFKVSAKRKIPPGEDTAFTNHYKPGIAIKRSAMLPGWGQYTNKKYWKIPIVYAGIGIPAYLFFRNVKQYKEAKNAFANATDGNPANDILIPEPYFSVRGQPDRIKSFRNEVRQNADYSVIFFIVFWGLNVADAAVDAHLKTFNVSDDLSLNFKAGYSPMANTTGVSLVLNIGRPPKSPKGGL
jgi:Family of unknown function (DUF5683)